MADPDSWLTPIHERLAQTRRLPQTHLVAAGYLAAGYLAAGLATAQSCFQVDVVGPTRGNFRGGTFAGELSLASP